MNRHNLCLVNGETFSRTFRYGGPPYLYRPITGIARSAPVRITAVGHGIPGGWPVAVVSVQGMRQINAEIDDKGRPKPESYFKTTVIDADTVDLNAINSSEFSAYASGGSLQLYTPQSLAGCTPTWIFKDKVGGTTLLTLSSGTGITLDDTAKTIAAQLSIANIALLGTRGVHVFSMLDGGGKTKILAHGAYSVTNDD